MEEQLTAHGVDVRAATRVGAFEPAGHQVLVRTSDARGDTLERRADLVLVVTGVAPDTALAVEAGASVGVGRAVQVDRHMRTGLPDIWAPRYDRPPAVLFLCVPMSAGPRWLSDSSTTWAQGRATAWSAGSAPAGAMNPGSRRGHGRGCIDIAQEFPKPWTAEFLVAADVVVTMGCGEACPLIPGKRYEDWEIDNPDNKTLEEVRVVRDDIRLHVDQLLDRLAIRALTTSDHRLVPPNHRPHLGN